MTALIGLALCMVGGLLVGVNLQHEVSALVWALIGCVLWSAGAYLWMLP